MFTYNPKADRNRTSLQANLNGVSVEQMTLVFGRTPDGYLDDEKGYSGDEWSFSDDHGNTYVVYARWGELRIGMLSEVKCEHPLLLPAFEEWLRKQLDNGEELAV
jgi:hypothetical protein